MDWVEAILDGVKILDSGIVCRICRVSEHAKSRIWSLLVIKTVD